MSPFASPFTVPVALRIHSNDMVVFLEEIRPNHTKHGNTTTNDYIFTKDLYRITGAPNLKFSMFM
jgi:hypothetical protein